MFHDAETPLIEIGSIGWEDEEDYVFQGSDDNDGHTLIRVQLFRGRDPTRPLSPTRAQGIKMIAHINGGSFRIPPKNTRCYIVCPAGMEHMPGAAFIIGTVEKSPTTQFSPDRVVMDFGPDVHVVIKGKSVTLQDPEFRFVSVGSPRSGGAPGVQVHLPDGTGAAWQAGAFCTFVTDQSMMQMTSSTIELWQKTGNTTVLKMGSGEFMTIAPTNKMMGQGCFIGKAPTPANMALWGATGIAGVASTSVFISV